MVLSNFNDTQNKDIVLNIQDTLKLNPLTDAVPKAIVPTIQPTFEVHRKVSDQVSGLIATSTGVQTLLTASATKDTYITGATLSIIKDSTCDMASGAVTITCVPNASGVSKNLVGIAILTLTAQADSISIAFPTPIKIARGSIVTMPGAFTVGACSRIGTISYYTEDSGV